jgi:lipoic acid synthetase/lipoate-protein ligase A
MMKNVVLPDAVRRSLAFYLAMEEYVASAVEDEAFFVWRVEPTVIYGRNQVLENEVNLEYCREHGIDIVRRKSGGGCVYSDLGNIMVSYVSRSGDVSEVFNRYMTSLCDALQALGVPAEKSGRNDILVEGRKISGNAFHQLPDRSIVHGTLLYSTDLDALAEAIRPPVEKLQRHGVESVRQISLSVKYPTRYSSRASGDFNASAGSVIIATYSERFSTLCLTDSTPCLCNFSTGGLIASVKASISVE